MKKFLKKSWIMCKITTTMQINSFISLLRKVPLLESLVPVSLYSKSGLKLLFALGGFIKSLFLPFIGGTIRCLFLISWLPAWLGIAVSKEEMLLLCILVHSFAPSLQSCGIFRAREADYVFLNHFMMDPTEYYHFKIGKEALEEAVSILPVLIYLLQDAWFVAVAMMADVFCTLAGACLYLFMYDKLRNMVKRSVRNVISYGVMAAVYIGMKFGVFDGIVFSKPLCTGLFITLLLASVPCCLRLLRYRDFKRIAVQFANKEAMIVVSVNTGMEEGKDALAGFSWQENKNFYENNKKLSAAKYLNKAFFERFRGVFSSQRKQIFIVSILLGVLIGYLIRSGVLGITNETILSYTPVLIVIVNSMMLFGQRFTMLCFRFVDMPLLVHQACEKEYLKESIRCRYAFLVKHSLVSLAGLTVFSGLVLLISGIRISFETVILLLVSMELFMLIQELYHLLIYYWIQPYTADVSVKSPVFNVLSIVEGMFDLGLLFIRGNLILVCVPLAGIFLIMNVLLALMAQRVHKSFRLRF